jgi:hypothetical protein
LTASVGKERESWDAMRVYTRGSFFVKKFAKSAVKNYNDSIAQNLKITSKNL